MLIEKKKEKITNIVFNNKNMEDTKSCNVKNFDVNTNFTYSNISGYNIYTSINSSRENIQFHIDADKLDGFSKSTMKSISNVLNK